MRFVPRFVRRWVIAMALRRELAKVRRLAAVQGAVALSQEAISGLLSRGPSEEDSPRPIWIMMDPARPEPQPEQKTQAPEREPGRQHVAMPREAAHGLMGLVAGLPWKPAVPRNAHSALWEDCHRFAEGAKPKRDPHYGLTHQEPPLAFICPACDLEQTPLIGGDRSCPYCGVKLKLHGTRVFWWREHVEIPEWRP